MAWTTPQTWTAGQVVGASDLNTHLRDNINYVLSGRGAVPLWWTSTGVITVNSSTFVDVDATNLKMTITLASGRIMGWWTATMQVDNTAHNVKAWLGTRVDDTTEDNASSAATVMLQQAGNTNYIPVVVPFAFTNLSQASHFVKLRGRHDGSAGAVLRVTSGTDNGVRAMVFEI